MSAQSHHLPHFISSASLAQGNNRTSTVFQSTRGSNPRPRSIISQTWAGDRVKILEAVLGWLCPSAELSFSVSGRHSRFVIPESCLTLLSPRTQSKKWSSFPSHWMKPSESFGLNLASWKWLGVLCWTFWELISLMKLAAFWQLLSSALRNVFFFFFFLFFWASMCKRNMKGNFALHHPGGTVQDMSTSNLCPTAAKES